MLPRDPAPGRRKRARLPLVRLVDRARSQCRKIGGPPSSDGSPAAAHRRAAFFDRPEAVESGAEQLHVALRQQPYGDDAFALHVVRNAPMPLKCLLTRVFSADFSGNRRDVYEMRASSSPRRILLFQVHATVPVHRALLLLSSGYVPGETRNSLMTNVPRFLAGSSGDRRLAAPAAAQYQYPQQQIPAAVPISATELSAAGVSGLSATGLRLQPGLQPEPRSGRSSISCSATATASPTAPRSASARARRRAERRAVRNYGQNYNGYNQGYATAGMRATG